MSDVQDSTHGSGIAHLRRAASINRRLVERYNTDDPLIQCDGLEEFCDRCTNGLETVYSGERTFNEARANRKTVFEGADTWGTQLANTLKSSKASESTVKAARDLVKKIRGERTGKEPDAAGSDTPAEDIQQQISVAQTTYDNRLEHVRKLVALAVGHGAAYKATAEEMKVPALQRRLADMEAANRQVTDSAAAYSTALIDRDRLLYHPQTGAPARMDAIRTWYNSTFGAGSAERKLLTGLRVRTLASKRLQAV